jgi:hypothetical protein
MTKIFTHFRHQSLLSREGNMTGVCLQISGTLCNAGRKFVTAGIGVNFWISPVLALTTVSYERRSLLLALDIRHFPRVKIFKLFNSKYAVKPWYSNTVHRNSWRYVNRDGKSKECVKVISFDKISWELSVVGAMSVCCICKLCRPAKPDIFKFQLAITLDSCC